MTTSDYLWSWWWWWWWLLWLWLRYFLLYLQVRIFRFATGRMTKVFNESLQHYSDLHQVLILLIFLFELYISSFSSFASPQMLLNFVLVIFLIPDTHVCCVNARQSSKCPTWSSVVDWRRREIWINLTSSASVILVSCYQCLLWLSSGHTWVQCSTQTHTHWCVWRNSVQAAWLGLTLSRCDDSIASIAVDYTWPQRKRTTKEYLEERWRKRYGKQDTSRGLEEDGGGSTEQSWRWRRVVCGLCSKQAHGHRGRRRPRNYTWKRDLDKMWIAGYKYRWRKVETAAQNNAEDGELWSHGLCSTGNNKA